METSNQEYDQPTIVAAEKLYKELHKIGVVRSRWIDLDFEDHLKFFSVIREVVSTYDEELLEEDDIFSS